MSCLQMDDIQMLRNAAFFEKEQKNSSIFNPSSLETLVNCVSFLLNGARLARGADVLTLGNPD